MTEIDLSALKTKRRQVLREVPWGMLVWRCGENGEYAADEEGNIMHVFLADTKPQLLAAAKQALSEAAKSYGFPDGKCVFLSGRRPIDDEAYEHQLARADAGLVPDPLDPSAVQERMNTLQDGSRKAENR